MQQDNTRGEQALKFFEVGGQQAFFSICSHDVINSFDSYYSYIVGLYLCVDNTAD